MMKHAIHVFVVSTITILGLSSILGVPNILVSATSTGSSLRTRYANATDIIDILSSGHQNGTTVTSKSCSELSSCQNCTNTYTCHWCEKSQSCHARGSIHGCAWGNKCKDPNPPKKKNNTCAAQTTCSDCAKHSHFCHWCEHDNACHSMGSRFGCTIGVNCYSNDRCRRSEPEAFPKPSSTMKAITDSINSVPIAGLVGIIFLGLVSFGCLSCCFCFLTNVKGAYDDLTDLTIAAASVAPMSVIGDARFTRWDEFREEEAIPEGENESNSDSNTNNDVDNDDSVENANESGEAMVNEALQTSSQESDNVPAPSAGAQDSSNEQQEQPNEGGDNPYYLMNDAQQNYGNRTGETRPLLHPAFNGGSVGFEEPRHMKRLFKYCSAFYYLSVMVIVITVGVSLIYYPKVPTYSICNDEVAWGKIIRNIVAFKIDASFEVLASLSNPNRIGVALDKGKGSFSFEGKEFGSFEIPPVTADPMSITDFMIIVRVSPADRVQAIQLAEAYYMGKLELEAEFHGTIRIPSFFDYTTQVEAKDIVIDISKSSEQTSDRSLCQCPSWDEDKNHSIAAFMQLMEE